MEKFNEVDYLRLYPDIAEAVALGRFSSGLDHFERYGREEGRVCNLEQLPLDFDAEEYREVNPDIALSGVDPAAHFVKHGVAEGRSYKRNARFSFSGGVFCDLPPSPKNAFDLFSYAWVTRYAGFTNGTFDALNDPRISWLCDRIQLNGLRVLELGPLEGGHSIFLEQAGCSVTAVEANINHFIKCLILKNHLNLSCNFILGDILKYDYGKEHYDLVVASGVLYHMSNPLELLVKLSSCTDKLFLWTHYFEEDLSLWNPLLNDALLDGKWGGGEIIIQTHGQSSYKLAKHFYWDQRNNSKFCGGTGEFSLWIFRNDLMRFLRDIGFQSIEIAFDFVDDPNGPSFCLFCSK